MNKYDDFGDVRIAIINTAINLPHRSTCQIRPACSKFSASYALASRSSERDEWLSRSPRSGLTRRPASQPSTSDALATSSGAASEPKAA